MMGKQETGLLMMKLWPVVIIAVLASFVIVFSVYGNVLPDVETFNSTC